MTLAEPLSVGPRTAPTRVVFGPHETNLGRRRSISSRHVAYYAARAAGGAGVIVTETASVHDSDWPYERAPLARECAAGWRTVAAVCRPHGTLVLAGLGHAGAQGSSAYSQAVLWGPSRVADAISREMPAPMERDEIAAVVAGFAAAASLAAAAGLDGVEIDAGPISLLRQFHSGLTNLRGDEYGADKLRFTREVLAAVRDAIGADRVLALRLSCDELAPWAGITPEQAEEHVDAFADAIDLLTVVRGGPFSVTAYRPDAHVEPLFNRALCTRMRGAAAGRCAVVLQGSVVDPGDASAAVSVGAADLVECTRAQIADPRFVAHVRAGTPEQIRPCVLCNQACRVRDPRNQVVSCIVEPESGYETLTHAGGGEPREVLIVGAGPAGLECARELALLGHTVTVAEREAFTGGALRIVGRELGNPRMVEFCDWLEEQCRWLGVTIELGREVTPSEALAAGEEAGMTVQPIALEAAGAAAGSHAGRGWLPAADVAGHRTAVAAPPGHRRRDVIVATGSRPARTTFPSVDALSALAGAALPEGAVLVHDPVGDVAGVAVAEWLAAAGRTVSLVTQDQVAGVQLARTGDLADANGRLQRAGIGRELRSMIREAGHGRAVLEDVWTGERREVPCAVVVDCGHRLPDQSLPGPRAGDCVAPRGVLPAILEGRRLARDLGA
ncbi:mycofactocin system FadH/OYE family oxidoreductase 1 [Candidatus Solirubrobacter pratensis]|uniref:mycofactocin system FadH/OYE family oxidoreductase 1 n=1 Tax=Candidatus Solirubrobacter pratensis TaxID=1298857 RepID=UPI00055AAD55|nr:mycofactocin system FadH/OYE family oxidoreductase 1 [Candidatus Solirubrobacter pratensis]